MRHFLTNVAVYTIGSVLLVGAALFGWLRAEQVTLSDENTIVEHYASAERPGFDWMELGASSYVRNCSTCHGHRGEGWDQYPGLSGSSRFLGTSDGRRHLIDLHLYGLTSDRWRAPMPPMGHMPDVELAAVINHVATRFAAADATDQRLFEPDEIAARRGLRLTPYDVEANRPATE